MFYTWTRKLKRGFGDDYWSWDGYVPTYDDSNYPGESGGGYDNSSQYFWDESSQQFLDTSGWNTGPVDWQGTQWNFTDVPTISDSINISGGSNDQYVSTVGIDPNIDALGINPIPYLDFPTIDAGDIDSVNIVSTVDDYGNEIIPYTDPISGLTLDLKPYEPYPLPPNPTPLQKTDWKKKTLNTTKKVLSSIANSKGGAGSGAGGGKPSAQQPKTTKPTQGKCPPGYTLNPQSNLCVQNSVAPKPDAEKQWYENPMILLAIAGGALLIAVSKK